MNVRTFARVTFSCWSCCGLLWLAAPAEAQKVFLNCSNQFANPVSGGGNEAEYALDNANRTRDLLVALGFDVIVDQDFNNSPRHANTWGADIFISIHSNAGGGHGTECLFASAGGRQLSAALQDGLLGQFNFGDRGLKERHDLHVLNNTAMFASLPEVVFHDCTRDHGGITESAFLRSGDGRQQISRGLRDGVCGYYGRDCADGPPPPAYAATFQRQEHPARMVSGERVVAWIEYRNDGTATWSMEQTFLATTVERDRASPFFDPENWPAPNRLSGPDHSNYATGAVGRFTFMLRAPEVARETRFVEHFGLVQEGVAWFGPPDDAVFFEIVVTPAQPEIVDEDGDRHAAAESGGDDCNDHNPLIHPGIADTCGDGQDSNCDGEDPECPIPPDGGVPGGDVGFIDAGAAEPDLGQPGSVDLGQRVDPGAAWRGDAGSIVQGVGPAEEGCSCQTASSRTMVLPGALLLGLLLLRRRRPES